MNSRRAFVKKSAITGTCAAMALSLTFGSSFKASKEKINISPPLDIYYAAGWCAIAPLSEVSVENNGEPQDFPDFTRGNWIKHKPFDWMKVNY